MGVKSKAKVTSKGQITIPLIVCQQLGVEIGDIVTLVLTDDGIRLAREREPGVFAKWAGGWRTGGGHTAVQIDKRLRSIRGHDDE